MTGAVRRRRRRGPAAYSPHSAWLNATTSPCFGWLVNSATTSRRFCAEHVFDEAVERLLRADLDEHAGALRVERAQALDELHRRGDLAGEDVEHLLLHVRHPSGTARRRRWRRSAASATGGSRRTSACRSGSLAGATIDVWNAWLTGSRIAVWPASVKAAIARSTAAVAPPITA